MISKHTRTAVVISSYKRPEALIRQLFCMLHQTRAAFTMFVAVKGITQHAFEMLSQGYFDNAVSSGKLVLTYEPNKNQLSNFLDAIRTVDPGDFDLYVKIDDDDFYGPDFIGHLVGEHEKRPRASSSFMLGDCLALMDGNRIANIKKPAGGSGCALTQDVIRALFDYEAMEPASRMESICAKYPRFRSAYEWDIYGMNEDALMKYFALMFGIFNLWDNLPAERRAGRFIPRRTGASVMRQGAGYLHTQFRNGNMVVTTDPGKWEHSICLGNGDEHVPFFVIGDRIYEPGYQSSWPVTSFSPDRCISVQWMPEAASLYRHRGKGIYRHETGAFLPPGYLS